MIVSSRGGLLPVAAIAALLLAFGLAAATGTAGAKAGDAGGLKNKNYVGTSAKDSGAKLLVKAQVSDRGVPKKVSLIKLTGATAQCATEPNSEKAVPTPLSWTFDRYSVPVTLLDNAKGQKRRTFEVTQTNGGAPTEGEEEEIAIIGRFAPNLKMAAVSVDLELVVKGSSVKSSKAYVNCSYNSSFRVHAGR